jgi:hypothetical protein
MTPEAERRIIERWPSWFRVDGDTRETLMPLGFQCQDGWFALLWRLCEDLEPLAAELERKLGVHFEVLEVKQKFGRLRIFVKHRTDPISELIEVTEAESMRTCEVCGKPGMLRSGESIQTLCDGCVANGGSI